MKINLKKGWKNFKAVCFGIIIALILCEIILRIYNPFPFSVQKGKLILASNQKKIFTNNWIEKLDKKIYYSRNSLGFRGPEPPDSLSRLLSFITVGGSTTECKFQSDSITWSFLVYKTLNKKNPKVWLNNAGLDGHSTFGHLLLLDEYILKLKPNFVLFLTGINDEEIAEPDEFDLMTEKKINASSIKGFMKSVLNHTELGRTAFNFYHVQVAYKKGLIHREIKVNDLVDNPMPDSVVLNRIENQATYIKAYRQRINNLVEKCLQAGVTPILITQPSLFGDYVDSATHIRMTNKWTKKDGLDNCMLEEKILELYNDVLRSFKNKIMVIDLSKEMPKNSNYFYDFTHFTNQGAGKVAEVLSGHLQTLVSNDWLK